MDNKLLRLGSSDANDYWHFFPSAVWSMGSWAESEIDGNLRWVRELAIFKELTSGWQESCNRNSGGRGPSTYPTIPCRGGTNLYES